MRVLVSGRIQTGSYTNRDGQKVYTTDIVVDDQEFADSKTHPAAMKAVMATAISSPDQHLPVPLEMDS